MAFRHCESVQCKNDGREDGQSPEVPSPSHLLCDKSRHQRPQSWSTKAHEAVRDIVTKPVANPGHVDDRGGDIIECRTSAYASEQAEEEKELDIGSKTSSEVECGEKNKGANVHHLATLKLREWSEEQWSQREAEYVQRRPANGDVVIDIEGMLDLFGRRCKGRGRIGGAQDQKAVRRVRPSFIPFRPLKRIGPSLKRFWKRGA